MATRNHSRVATPGKSSSAVIVVRWDGLLNGDVGDDVSFPPDADITFQVFGTFGAGGSISLEGTNESTPTNRNILNDSRGGANPVTLTAAGVKQVLESVLWVRPRVTAGDGTTSLTVIMSAVGGGH